jgi:hypothetical protein
MYLTGALADGVGYQTTFLILLGLNLLILPLLSLVFRPGKEKAEVV